ncbi:MAG: hypothetical protein AB7H81_03280 [Vicinamibacterales bacterium]
MKTTNLLESIHAKVETRVQRVDHWRSSDQEQRWLATALLDLEPQLRRIRNYQALPLLRQVGTATACDEGEDVSRVNQGTVTQCQLRMALNRQRRSRR